MFKKVTFIGLLFCLFVTIGTSVFASSLEIRASSDYFSLTRDELDSAFESNYLEDNGISVSADDYVMYSFTYNSNHAFIYIPKSSGISYLDTSFIRNSSVGNMYVVYAYDSFGNQLDSSTIGAYELSCRTANTSSFSGFNLSSLYVWSCIYDISDIDFYCYGDTLLYDGDYSYLGVREILLNITYDDTYSKAIFSAELLNAQDGDKLYYSTLVDARNNLINPIEMKYNSIYTVNASRNGMVFFQVIDSEGTTVCSESIYLKSLDGFTSDKFDISMESMTASMYDYWVRVKGKYTDSIEGSYYDCYVSYTLSDTKNTYAGLNLDGLTNIESEEARAYAQDTFYAFDPSIDFFDVHTTTKNVNVSVIFKFVNKETGYTCGYKRVDFVVSSAQNPLYPQYRFYF